MRPVVRGFLLLAFLIAGILLASYLYAQYLVDNSLHSLELAMDSVQENPMTRQAVDGYVYRNILQSLVIEEASKEMVNYRHLSFLELALRSFDEANRRGSYGQTIIYLNQVRDSKVANRSWGLRFLDRLYARGQKIVFHLKRQVWRDFRRGFISESADLDEAYEYSGLPLLEEAREKEGAGDYANAEFLYRTFLRLNSVARNQSWIQNALAYTLIQQKKYDKAEEILRQILTRDSGLTEGDIAKGFLGQIKRLRKTESEVSRLAELDARTQSLDEGTRFKLGLGYLATYDYALAQKSFEKLLKAASKDIRQRSGYYLSLIFKMTNRLEEGQILVTKLLSEEDLERDLNLALSVQLADIYHRSQDLDKSLSAYDSLFVQSYGDATLRENLRNAWMALAELEKASIYFFSKQDIQKGNQSLEKVEDLITNFMSFTSTISSFYNQSSVYYRDLAFVALQQGRVRSAHDLLKKSLELKPDDAWALSAFGTTSLLLGKVEQGLQSAERGYRQRADEYTCAVLGYIYEILGRADQAEKLYEEALVFNPDYLPARFNVVLAQKAQGKYEKALKRSLKLTEALKDANKIIRAKNLVNSGCLYFDLGRVKDAIQSFKRTLALIPDFEVARHNLAQLEIREQL